MSESEIKMVISDLDGTLLNHRGALSKKTKETLIELQKRGIKVVLCTGRPYHSCKDIIEQLHLQEYGGGFIGLNGQILHDYATKTVMEKETLDEKDLSSIFEIATSFKAFSMEFYHKEDVCIIFSKKSHFVSWVVSFLYAMKSFIHQSKHYHLKFLKSIPSGITPGKVCFLGLPKRLKLLMNEIEKSSKYTAFFVHKGWLEVLKKGINKGAALKEIATLSNIPLNQVVAFGDGENDVSLLQTAGRSFAVSNAMNKTKSVADEIIGVHYNDAVAKKCQELFNLNPIKKG